MAEPLTLCPGNTRGSLPSTRIYADQFACINGQKGEPGHWVRAHVLHGRTSGSGPFHLHGPGNEMRNLVITDKTLNGNMRRGAEAPAIARVHGLREVLWYESKVESYFPGLDFFARSIKVDFGRFDPLKNRRGPRIGGGSFSGVRTPPNCPALVSSEPVVPAVPPPAAASEKETRFGFESTVRVCLRELQSRVFPVEDGGLVVRLDLRHLDPSGLLEIAREDCLNKTFMMTLIDVEEDFVVSETELAVGESVLEWEKLPRSTYRLKIERAKVDPRCCLTGDISVHKFSAPNPHGPQTA